MDDKPQVGRFGQDPRKYRGERVVDQQAGAAGIGQPEHDLGRGEPGIDRHEDDTCPGEAEEAFQITVTVQGQDANPITWLEPKAGQGAREARGSGGEGRPVPSPIAEYGCDPSRIDLQRAAQELRDLRHVETPCVRPVFWHWGHFTSNLPARQLVCGFVEKVL